MAKTELYQEEFGDMYRLGREARELGYPKESCNIRTLSAKRSFWLAGWIDKDIESGNREFHDKRSMGKRVVLALYD